MKRIALVTSSKARKEKPTVAKKFYSGSYNRWVNKVIEYLEAKSMEDSSYFLSFHQERIIPFNEVIENYPVHKKTHTAAAKRSFALKIVDFLLRFKEKPFVELHTGKDISVPLVKLLDEYGFSYKIYAQSVPLGLKPRVYEELIEKEQQKHRAKEIKRGHLRLVHSLEYQTPAQAKLALQQFENNPTIYEGEIESTFEELKAYINKHYNRSKDMRKARNEFEKALNAHPDGEELLEFINKISTLQGLYADIPEYEYFNRKFSKELAKYEYYKIKESYVVRAEYRIHEIMSRLSILLLKKKTLRTKPVIKASAKRTKPLFKSEKLTKVSENILENEGDTTVKCGLERTAERAS